MRAVVLQSPAAYSAVALVHLVAYLVLLFLAASDEVHQQEMVEEHLASQEVHREVPGVSEELDHYRGEVPAVPDHFPEDHQQPTLDHCWQMEVSWDQIQADHYQILVVHSHQAENRERSPTDVVAAVVAGPGSLPVVMVGPGKLAMGCSQGGVACREGTVEIQRTAEVEVAVHLGMESLPELQTAAEELKSWQQGLIRTAMTGVAGTRVRQLAQPRLASCY